MDHPHGFRVPVEFGFLWGYREKRGVEGKSRVSAWAADSRSGVLNRRGTSCILEVKVAEFSFSNKIECMHFYREEMLLLTENLCSFEMYRINGEGGRPGFAPRLLSGRSDPLDE